MREEAYNMPNEGIKINSTCPTCKSPMELSIDPSDILGELNIPETTSGEVPATRANIKPGSNILVYNITSDDIRNFVLAKARQYVPNVKVEVVPKYTEKKASKYESRKSYASMAIALSDEVVEKSTTSGWYEKLGDDGNIRMVDSIFKNLILKYKHEKKVIDSWLTSYDKLERLEKQLGITASFLNDIKAFTTPKRVVSADKQSCVIFSAAAEYIINDMLQDPDTGKVKGSMIINDVYPISKDVVGFQVYVSPESITAHENVFIRQILTGDSKKR